MRGEYTPIMRVLTVETGGVARLWGQGPAPLLCAPGFIGIFSPVEHERDAACARLRDAVIAGVGRPPIYPRDLVIVVPFNIDRDAAKRVCERLHAPGIAPVGVISQLALDRLDGSDDKTTVRMLAQSGDAIGFVDPPEGFEPLVDLAAVFRNLYAGVRLRLQRLSSRDLVRVGVTVGDVADGAIQMALDEAVDPISVGTGVSRVELPRAVVAAALDEALAEGRKAVMGACAESPVAIATDETAAALMTFGLADGAERPEFSVQLGRRVADEVASFWERVRAEEPTPFLRVGTLAIGTHKQSPEVPNKSMSAGASTSRTRQATVLLAGFIATTAWAAGTTVWTLVQRAEIRDLRATIAAGMVGDPGTISSNEGLVTVGGTSDGSTAAARDEAVPDRAATSAAPPPAHRERRRTQVGVDVTHVKVADRDGFWIGTFEVTRSQYGQFAAATGRRVPGSGAGDYAIVGVGWEDAKAFCEWASSADPSWNYRLPSVSEWQLACRAGASGHFGEGLSAESASINTAASFVNAPWPVHNSGTNAWGIRGKHGNAAEWAITAGGSPELLGGSFSSPPDKCGCDSSTRPGHGERPADAGFRVVAEQSS